MSSSEESRKRMPRQRVWWLLFLSLALGFAYGSYRLRVKALRIMDRVTAAHHAIHCGRMHEAEVALKQALLADPRALDARDMLAVLYDSRGLPQKAYAERQAAIKADPRNPDAHYLLACAYVADRRYPEAIASLERVVALNPRHRIARHLLARCHIWNREPAKAVQVFEAILTDDPRDAVARRGLQVAKERVASGR